MKDPLITLLEQAIIAQTAETLKDRQLAKMQGGKANKALLRANDRAKAYRSGVKLDN